MSLFPLCTGVMLRTLLAMVLAVLATLAGVGWYQVQSMREAQRPYLLGLAFAGGEAVRGQLRGAALPVQFTREMEESLRNSLSKLAESDAMQAVGTGGGRAAGA
jgi:hypothetical protein